MAKNFLTTSQAARHPAFPAPVSTRTIHRHLRMGLRSRLVGGKRWIDEADLVAWLASRSKPTGTARDSAEDGQMDTNAGTSLAKAS